MIKIACDNCEVVFEVDPAEAGGKVSCPECGDINRVPAKAPAGNAASEPTSPHVAGPGSGPEAKGLPPDHGPEQEICVIRPAMFRAHPLRGSLLAALLAGGGVLAIWSTVSESVGAWVAWVGVVLMAGSGVGWLVWFLAVHMWIKLRISNKRTVRREGIIKRHTSEVLHNHVRNVEIKQSFSQRIFNVGSLGISSSGQEGIEIEIMDIPDPLKVKALIDEYRDM